MSDKFNSYLLKNLPVLVVSMKNQSILGFFSKDVESMRGWALLHIPLNRLLPT